MEYKLAYIFSKYAAKQGYIKSSDIQTYQYGFELLLSSVVSVVLVVAIAFAFGNTKLALAYLFGFIPIRVYAGGYHGRSHTECYFAFATSFTLCLLLSMNTAGVQLLPIVTCLVLFLIMVGVAPVEAKNKPLTKQRRNKNRRISIFLSLIDLIVASVLFAFHVELGMAGTIYYLSKWIVALFVISPGIYDKVSKEVFHEAKKRNI